VNERDRRKLNSARPAGRQCRQDRIVFRFTDFAMARVRMLPRLRRIAVGLMLGVNVGGGAIAGDMKEFRDWLAACDNARTCNAYGFDSDAVSGAYLRLERAGSAHAQLLVTIAVSVREGSKFSLSFDDPNLGGLPTGPVEGNASDGDDLKRVVISDPQAIATLMASLRRASKLIVTRIDRPGAPASDPVTTEISLAGSAAAMLWMDEQQKRAGTVTALVARGDKPATAVPVLPPLPAVVVAKAALGGAPKKAPAVVIAKAREVCDDTEAPQLEDVTRLGAREVMYWFPCTNLSGAYNYVYALLIDAPGRPAREAEFRLPRELARDTVGGGETNVNPGYDKETRTLSMFNKGRGIGDCGWSSAWAWDGRVFRMLVARSMPACKGVGQADWPVLYRAERR
jgi:hypothetical protein